MPAATLRALHLGEYHALDVTARYELLSMLCDLVLATATARRLLDDRSARVEAIEWDWETATQVGLAQLQPLTIPPRVLPLGRDRDSSTVYWSLPTALAVVRQQYGEPDLKAGTVDEAAAAAFAAAAAAAKAAAGDVPPTPPPPPMPPAAAPAAADAAAAGDDAAPAAEGEGRNNEEDDDLGGGARGGGARGGAGGRDDALREDAPSMDRRRLRPRARPRSRRAVATARLRRRSALEDAAIREGCGSWSRWRGSGGADAAGAFEDALPLGSHRGGSGGGRR